jgi:hypothetical protein
MRLRYVHDMFVVQKFTSLHGLCHRLQHYPGNRCLHLSACESAIFSHCRIYAETKPEDRAERLIGIDSSAPPRVGESTEQMRTAAAWPGDQEDAEAATGVGQEPTRGGRGEDRSAAAKLRAILRVKGKCSVAMGCHDAMGAKLIEEAGFEICFFSGFALSASRLGMPDVGLATYNEMVEAGRAICDAVDIPVIGDGDTGYGSVLNVRRTVQVTQPHPHTVLHPLLSAKARTQIFISPSKLHVHSSRGMRGPDSLR